MKKLSKILIFVLLGSSLLNCENEEPALPIVTQDIADEKIQVFSFGKTDIPDITEEIESTAKAAFSGPGSKNGKKRFRLDTDNIIGVKDSVGNVTYALRLYVRKGPKNSIFNVVVTKRADGKKIKPYIMEYVMKAGYFSNPRQSINQRKAIRYYALKGFLKRLVKNTLRGDNVPLDPCGILEESSSSGGNPKWWNRFNRQWAQRAENHQ